MGSSSLICYSPLGKLAPGNAEIDKVFKDMWVEAEKNRAKWSCKSQYRRLVLACFSWSTLINLVSTQISGELPPCLIFRTVKGSLLFIFHIGRISKASRNLRLLLSTVWARMLTLQRNSHTWESCTRPTIHQRAPGKLSMTTCLLLDLVSQHVKCSSIRKCVLLTLATSYRKSHVRDRRGPGWP